MDQASIVQYIRDTHAGVDVVVGSREAGSPEIAWGDTFFFHGTGRKYPFPFATIVTKDYDNDRASNLDRPGVFRLNIGISKPTYLSLFEAQPSSSGGGAGDASHDLAALDQLMPHPVYGQMFWICVLNPSAATFQIVRPLLAEAYELAGKREIGDKS